MSENEKTTQDAIVAIHEENSHNTLIKLQKFTALLNKEPDKTNIDKTPDGNAYTLPISFVEMTLDELFFGQWSLSEPHYQREFNEIVGSAVLTVVHPISGREIKRVGFASVVITQDKDTSIAQFNEHKKKNALDLSFPKMKAEILKNAAASLGKIFGRDLNRKKKDSYNSLIKGEPENPIPQPQFEQLMLNVAAATEEQFDIIIKIPMSQDQREQLMGKRLESDKLELHTSTTNQP